MSNFITAKFNKLKKRWKEWTNNINVSDRVVNWVKSEVKSIMKDPVSRAAIAVSLWICLYAWIADKNDHQYYEEFTSRTDYSEQVAEWKDSTLYGIAQKIMFDAVYQTLQNIEINWIKLTQQEAHDYSIWFLKEVEINWNLKSIIPTSKTRTFLAFLNLLYVYIYTITIRKTKERNMPVATASFTWFSLVNFWFAIKNGIIMYWAFNFNSIWYLWACIMWAITVLVNEQVKFLIDEKIVKQWVSKEVQEVIDEKIENAIEEMAEQTRKELLIQEILKENAVGENNPVIIYLDNWEWKSFHEEKPIFWNPAWEKITWYSYDEVKNKSQKEIIKMLYWYSRYEYKRTVSHLKNLCATWKWYKDVVFTAKTKNWNLVKLAWHTKKIEKYWMKWRISFWSIDQAEIYRILRNDTKFDCLNSNSLKEDFKSIISQYGDTEKVKEENKKVALVWVDLDSFKNINDEFWHLFWDIVLNEFIEFVKTHLYKKEDSLYREWWDEFILLFIFTNKQMIENKIRELWEEFARYTINVDFEDWKYSVNRWEKHPDWFIWAKELYNKYIENWTRKIDLENFVNKTWKWKIILPPVTTSWWITDFAFNKDTLDENINTILILLKSEADSALLESKAKWKNCVTIFEKSLNKDWIT